MTYNLAALHDLAQRCKSATGPDRELDGRIWAELDGRDVREASSYLGERSLLAKSRRGPYDEYVVLTDGYGTFFTLGQSPEPPRVTGSIDAAMAMVERVLGYRMRQEIFRQPEQADGESGNLRAGL